MEYSFRAKVWKYKGPAGWYFVTISKSLSNKIRKTHVSAEEGWGRLKVTAKIGRSKWNTAIWYDTKFGSYLLPIKTSVRKAENIEADTRVKITLKLERIDPIILRWNSPKV